MAREQSATILDPLRRLITRQTGSALSDTQLLDNFVTRRDEPSFEVLVWRHGAMVLALCKRVLRDAHEAEDAFQATFLVFARKASSIGRSEVVAAWLYKVAYRIALRLRDAAAKRAAPGAPTDELAAPEPIDDADWRDLKPVLDDEIARLPEKYRAPFVLCYLEGRTNEEAATHLGCPKGTVLSRLSRGRERLRARLARRGVALTATALALALTQNAATAAVPAALVSPTVGAACLFAAGQPTTELVNASVAALTEGMLKAMTHFKAKIAAAVLALALLGTGITVAANANNDPQPRPEPVAVALPAPVPEPADTPNANPAEERQPRERPAAAAPSLTGRVVSVAKDGKSFEVETPPTERGGAPGKAAVTLADKDVITYQGVGLNGATPTVGYQAQVWIAKDPKEAATVVFNGPENGRRGPDAIGSVVSHVDKKSITLQMHARERPQRGEELPKETIPFDDKTVVTFSGVSKDGAKIAATYTAFMWYADDGKTAAKVQLHGIGFGEQMRREEKQPDWAGKVTKITPDGTTGQIITIEVPPAERGAEPHMSTFVLDNDVPVIFNDVPLDGAKIAIGQSARVWLRDDRKDAVATKVAFTGTAPERWKILYGTVAAVAKDGSSITVESHIMRGIAPDRTEVKLTAKTKLAFFGVGTGEAKPTEGLTVQVRLFDGSADTASLVNFMKSGGRRER